MNTQQSLSLFGGLVVLYFLGLFLSINYWQMEFGILRILLPLIVAHYAVWKNLYKNNEKVRNIFSQHARAVSATLLISLLVGIIFGMATTWLLFATISFDRDPYGIEQALFSVFSGLTMMLSTYSVTTISILNSRNKLPYKDGFQLVVFPIMFIIASFVFSSLISAWLPLF